MYIMLANDLSHRSLLIDRSRRHAAPRVACLTMDGVPCVLPGLQRFPGDMTMPSRFDIGAAIGQTWIRTATATELSEDPAWWRQLAFIPRSIVHCNGFLATPEDTFGMHGVTVTILQQSPVIIITEVECDDVEYVSTPPTPT